MTTAALENTHWKLTRLGDQPVIVAARQREPHLILQPEAQLVGGSAGCNRLSGAYRVQGGQLAFERMVTTKMACREGMDTEQAFLAALAQVRSWKILGQHLELLDASGTLLARFEARSMK
jgi:heat shock protein HslJ